MYQRTDTLLACLEAMRDQGLVLYDGGFWAPPQAETHLESHGAGVVISVPSGYYTTLTIRELLTLGWAISTAGGRSWVLCSAVSITPAGLRALQAAAAS